jgi:hypothetical protein
MFNRRKLTVQVRMSKEERELLEEVAIRLRRSCSDTLRVLALEKAEEMGLTETVAPPPETSVPTPAPTPTPAPPELSATDQLLIDLETVAPTPTSTEAPAPLQLSAWDQRLRDIVTDFGLRPIDPDDDDLPRDEGEDDGLFWKEEDLL